MDLGSYRRRVATYPTLRQVAGVTDADTYRQAGEKVMDYLTKSIRTLEGPHPFERRALDSHRTIWALRILLKLEGRGEDAPTRRYRAINILQLSGHTPEQWRRDPSPERDLLRILAAHMCGSAAEQAPGVCYYSGG